MNGRHYDMGTNSPMLNPSTYPTIIFLQVILDSEDVVVETYTFEISLDRTSSVRQPFDAQEVVVVVDVACVFVCVCVCVKLDTTHFEMKNGF